MVRMMVVEESEHQADDDDLLVLLKMSTSGTATDSEAVANSATLYNIVLILITYLIYIIALINS